MAWVIPTRAKVLVERTFADRDPVEAPDLPRLTVAAARALLLYRYLKGSNYHFAGAAQLLRTQLERHLSTEPDQGYDPIPVFDLQREAPETFLERFIDRARPVVIRGFRCDAQRWTVDDFIARYGDEDVMLSDVETKRNFPGKVADLRGRSPEGNRCYIHNMNEVFARHGEALADGLNLRGLADLLLDGELERNFAAQMFVGATSSSGSPYHAAFPFNFFFQLQGRKRWRFVPPEYTLLLYPFLSSSRGYYGSVVSGLDGNEERDRAFPLYRKCKKYEVVVEEGDVLLTPPFWWHAVSNLTEESLAVATRWAYFGVHDTNRLFTLMHLLRPLGGGWHAHDDANHEVHIGKGVTAWGFPHGFPDAASAPSPSFA